MSVSQCITLLKKNDSWGLNISFLGVATNKKIVFSFLFFKGGKKKKKKKKSNLRITLSIFHLTAL